MYHNNVSTCLRYIFKIRLKEWDSLQTEPTKVRIQGRCPLYKQIEKYLINNFICMGYYNVSYLINRKLINTKNQ